MQHSKSEFDYQSVLEAYGIQDVNLKKAFEGKSEAEKKFQEHCAILNKLTKEKTEKSEHLSKAKLDLDKYVQKIEKMTSKTSVLNNEIKNVHDDISKLNLEVQKQSDDFAKKIKKMDEDLRTLYAQFEGETLNNLVIKVDDELQLSRDMEAQLREEYEQLKNSQSNLQDYERLPMLKDIIVYNPEPKEMEEIEEKIAKKKKNVEFLMLEYDKKLELLQKYA